MATSGLYGSSPSGATVAAPGSETAGLYGNGTTFGGTYFEWFIFIQSDLQPATPTGGSWNFTTNSGTPPTGWSSSPPPAPTLPVWVSIALVNSKNASSLTWSEPGVFSYSSGLPILSGTGSPTSGDGLNNQLWIQTGTTPQTIWFKEAGTWVRLSGSTLYVDTTNNQTIAGTKTFSSVIQGSVSGTSNNVTGIVSIVNGGTGATTANGALVSLGALGDVTSTDGTVVITSPTATTRDLSVALSAATNNVVCQVRNTTGATLAKGTVVYISGATGQIPTVSKALATSDATSAQTLGMVTTDLPNNTNGNVTIIGLINDIDTSAYADGAQLYLSGTTAGTVTATKPYAPIHLVYVAVVEYSHAVHGKLFVKVQNGYELDEIHNVSAQTPSNGQTIVYNSSTGLWTQNTVSLTAGVNGTLPVANGGTGVTSSTGTGSVVLSTSPTLVTPVLGTPTSGNFSSGTFTWPTFNQNTTGTAANITATSNSTLTTLSALSLPGSQVSGNITGNAGNVTGIVAIANGGTGQITANAAFNALAPSQTGNSGKYLTTDGSNTSWATNPLGTVTSVGGTGTVSGITLSGTVTTSGNLTLGGALDLSAYNGAGAFTTLSASSTVTLSGGTANGVAYLNGSKVVTSGSALTFDGTDTFTVGATNTGVLNLGLSAAYRGKASYDASGNTLFTFENTYANASAGIAWKTNGSEQMRLNSTGLGIGTSSPASKLHVVDGGGVLRTFDNTDGIILTSYSASKSIGFSTSSAGNYGSDGGSNTFLKLTPGVSGSMLLGTGGTTRVTLDSSGNLGLGVTPSAWGVTASQVKTASMWSVNNRTYIGANYYYNSVGTRIYINSDYATEYAQFNGAHSWYTAASGTAGGTISFTQAMTLDASGNLLVGTTSSSGRLTIVPTVSQFGNVINAPSSSGTYFFEAFQAAGTGIGSITSTNGTVTLYNTTSDYRLKNVIGSVTGHGERIDALEPIEYEWKSDGSRTRGFLAHKFQEVYAGSVTGTKDAVDEDGKPVYQAMQAGSSEVIADLVAEIQSLRKRLADAGI